MTIVTDRMNQTNTKIVNVTYDNSILVPSFTSLGYLVLTFVDGVTVDNSTGIKFFRSDRTGFYEVTDIKGSQFVTAIVPADVGYSSFTFNLGLTNTRDLTIDTSTANLYGVDDTEPEPEPDPDPDPELENITLNYNGVNFKAFNDGELWTDGETKAFAVDDVFTLSIEPDNDYKLGSSNELENVWGDLLDFVGTDDYQELEHTVIDSGTLELNVSTVKIPEPEPEPDPEPDPEPEPEPEFNFNKIYQVKNEVLNYLAKISPIPDTKPFTDYIINLIEIPFVIPEKHLSDVDSVIVGFSEFDQPAKKIDRDLIKFDVGEITVPEKYGNSYDYVNTDCILHLPYHSNITLDSNYVIDSTIRLEYYLNVYTGDGTINIYSSKIDDVIHSEKFKLGRVIPFVAKSDLTNEKPDVDFQLFNGLNRAYMEINRNIPIEGTNSNRVTNWGRLGDSEGYIEVADVQLNFTSNSQDKMEIKSILGNGVFIK